MRAWMTIGETSRRSGWSPRMLRYLEQEGLVVREPQGSCHAAIVSQVIPGTPPGDALVRTP